MALGIFVFNERNNMKILTLVTASVITLGLSACDRPAPKAGGTPPAEKMNSAPSSPPPSTPAPADPAKEMPKSTDPATPPPAKP
jgi:hypothetical protein